MEPDNNRVENAIRPTALGKKNGLFFGSEEAGRRSAVIYTLIENCRLHGVEPYAYLQRRPPAATRPPHQEVDQLTPLNGKQARESALNRAPEITSASRPPAILSPASPLNRGAPHSRLRTA